VHDILPMMGLLKKAFRQVRMSKQFAKLLALVLTVGNYLNGGTFNGRAYGFRLSFLPKLVDTRSTEPGVTLLHYLYKLVEEKHKDCLEWYSDFHDFAKASTISETALLEDVAALRRGVSQAESELQRVEDRLAVAEGESVDPAVEALFDRYATRLRSFVKSAKEKFGIVEEDMEAVQRQWNDLVEAFGEDSSFAQQEFFSVIGSFHSMWDQAQKDLAQRREQAAKKAAASMGGKGRRKKVSLHGSGGGVGKLLAEAQDEDADERRKSIRRAQSIRRAVAKTGDEKPSDVNNLLDLLDTLKSQAMG
jgi:Formin Homology 2 Domain